MFCLEDIGVNKVSTCIVILVVGIMDALVRLDSLCVDDFEAFSLVVVFFIIDLSVTLDGVIGNELGSLVVVRGWGNMVVEDGSKSIGVGILVTFFLVGIPLIMVVLVRRNGLSADEIEDSTVLEESLNLVDLVESGGIVVVNSGLLVIVIMSEVE